MDAALAIHVEYTPGRSTPKASRVNKFLIDRVRISPDTRRYFSAPPNELVVLQPVPVHRIITTSLMSVPRCGTFTKS